MALLDQVKKSLTSGFQLPQFGQSESIKQLQRASAGREVVGGEGGPQQGSLAETVAAAAAQQQQQEDILQGQVAAAGLEQQEKEQEQQFQQKTAQLDEQVLNVRQQMQNKTQEILQDFVQRRDELDFKANSARVQYALASMRLSNDDYLDKLEAEGARSRLEDQNAFEWELTQTIMADEMEMFKNDLSFKAAMNAEDREFKEYIAEFNIDQAIKLAVAEAEAAETQAQYQAYGQILQGTLQAGSMVAGRMEKNAANLKTTETTETIERPNTLLSTSGGPQAAPRTLNTQTTVIPMPGISRGGFAPPNDIPDYSQGGKPKFGLTTKTPNSELDI